MVQSQNSQCIALDNPQSIWAYFEKVRELALSGEPFPVKLSEVWPLVYSAKEKAVRALRINFIERIDYEVLTQKGENPQGGRPTEDYKLSVACMEFFIARKVRAVFEVYRKVFHHVVGTSLHVPQQNLINQVSRLEKKIDSLKRDRVKYFRAKVTERQQKRDTAKEKTKKEQIIEQVVLFCKARQYQTWNVGWNELNTGFRDYCGINLTIQSRYQGEDIIDVAIRNGWLDKLHLVAMNMFTVNKWRA